MAKDKSRFLLKLPNGPNFSVYVNINAWYMLIPRETIFEIYNKCNGTDRAKNGNLN